MILKNIIFNTLVKIDMIQAKVEKLGHEVHQQNAIYWMPKIAIKNNSDRPHDKIQISSLFKPRKKLKVLTYNY